MPARFYAPDACAAGETIALPDDEAEHAARVLRLNPGDAVRVFNGRGGEFSAVVRHAARGSVTVRLDDCAEPAPEARVAIALAHAVLKGDKMDDVVRDAVMMGVTTIHPIVTSRSEVSLAALERGHRRERWQRVAVASAKQCGRAVVPHVLAPAPFDGVPAAIMAQRIPSPAVMFVEPGAAIGMLSVREMEPAPPPEATVLIGPEGGWAPAEVDAGSRVCRLVTLGGRTLRADVTAVVAIAALFTRWKEF